jgi:hypothetical protein
MSKPGITPIAISVLGLFSGPSCVTDHDALAKTPAPDAGTGGAGGAGFSSASGATAGRDAGGSDTPVEPLGTTALTLLNGIVDAPRALICFSKVQADRVLPPVGSPLQLGFGRPVTFSEIDGLDFDADDILTTVIVGEIELLAALDCANAFERVRELGDFDGQGGASGGGGAGGQNGGSAVPPPLRAGPLPAIPAKTIGSGLSYLLIATGCVGAHDEDDGEPPVCGPSHTEGTASLSALLLKLSRIPATGVGIQVTNASLATERIDLRVASGDGAAPLFLASNVVYGAVEPKPIRAHSLSNLGVEADHELQVVTNGSVVLRRRWSQLLDVLSLTSGQNYTLALLGPAAGVTGNAWWNSPVVTLVPHGTLSQ